MNGRSKTCHYQRCGLCDVACLASTELRLRVPKNCGIFVAEAIWLDTRGKLVKITPSFSHYYHNDHNYKLANHALFQQVKLVISSIESHCLWIFWKNYRQQALKLH